MAASDPIALPEGASDERVDALYGAPLEDFTPRRDELAKELRGEGRREQAAWVTGLRKPTAAAWVVNQLARTQRGEAERLLEAGDRLRAAHERLLRGDGDAAEVRAAMKTHHEAVQALLARATGLLDSEGHAPSRATVDKVAQTLQAVAVDEESRRVFEVGRLTRERRAAGLGPFGEALAPSTGTAAKPRAKPATKQREPRRPRGKAPDPAAEKRKAEKADARVALKEAKAALRESRRGVTDAERALEDARVEEAHAAGRVADAERRLGRLS